MDDRGPPPPDGDVNKGPMLNAITWAECSVALVLVLARVITRTRLIKRWGWDDAFMCLAMACALVNTVCVTICIHYGTGRHVYYLNDHQKVQANKFNWISQGFHVMSTNWGKVSIGFFLLRIVDRAKRQRYIFFGVSIISTQFTKLPMLINNQPWGTISATAAAIVKTIFLAELVARADYTFETINLTTWISTEQYLIIIAACIPTLGPLFTAATGRTPSGRRPGSSPGYRPSGSHSRRYFHQGASGAGGSGHAFKKHKESDLLTYTMDDFTTTTVTDGWTRTSPPNGRRSDDGSEEAIIKGASDDVSRGDRGGSGERSHNSRGILKTMEVRVNSQNMERDTQRRAPANNKVLLPWEPTSPA
ncbi:hypothetical protein RJZ56_006907 [Blastomyces dermatitidis]